MKSYSQEELDAAVRAAIDPLVSMYDEALSISAQESLYTRSRNRVLSSALKQLQKQLTDIYEKEEQMSVCVHSTPISQPDGFAEE